MATVAELRARVTLANAKYIDVPAGSPQTRCQKCNADKLFWGQTKNKKLTLVDCAVAGAIVPTSTESGRGVSHFATCPEALGFKR